MNLLQKLNGETGKEYAYRVLKESIMSLELEPGQYLSETELANKLGISRTPIREVLMKLKEEHLIDVKPQIGTYVSLIDDNLINEAFFMRFVLEKEVLKLACSDLPEKSLFELDRNLASQKFVYGKENHEIDFHHLDNEFHEIIFSGVKLEEVWKGILKISTHYNRVRLLSELNNPNSSVIEQHEEIYNIIKNRDFSRIDSVLTEHLKKPKILCEYFFNKDSQYRDYFK
jgi:DNA-binding GntR family transcriptional regulator